MKGCQGTYFQLGYSDFEGEAVVEEAIEPGRTGRVKFQGSWWPARCGQHIVLMPGDLVRVVGVLNITLLVEPNS